MATGVWFFFLISQWGVKIFRKIWRGVKHLDIFESLTHPSTQSYKWVVLYPVLTCIFKDEWQFFLDIHQLFVSVKLFVLN